MDSACALRIIEEESDVSVEELADDNSFADSGVDSLPSLVITSRFRDALEVDIQHESLFPECPTDADVPAASLAVRKKPSMPTSSAISLASWFRFPAHPPLRAPRTRRLFLSRVVQARQLGGSASTTFCAVARFRCGLAQVGQPVGMQAGSPEPESMSGAGVGRVGPFGLFLPLCYYLDMFRERL